MLIIEIKKNMFSIMFSKNEKEFSRDFLKRVRHKLPIFGIQLTNPGRNDKFSESFHVATENPREIPPKWSRMSQTYLFDGYHRYVAMLLECFRVRFFLWVPLFLALFSFFIYCIFLQPFRDVRLNFLSHKFWLNQILIENDTIF